MNAFMHLIYYRLYLIKNEDAEMTQQLLLKSLIWTWLNVVIISCIFYMGVHMALAVLALDHTKLLPDAPISIRAPFAIFAIILTNLPDFASISIYLHLLHGKPESAMV